MKGERPSCKLAADVRRLTLFSGNMEASLRRLLPVAGLTRTVCARAAEKTPDLRPPLGEMPPGFWEQHGNAALVVAAIIALAGTTVLMWWRNRPRPVVVIPPGETARLALATLRARPQDAALVTEVSQVVRRYVLAVLPREGEEPTTEELHGFVSADARLAPELVEALTGFLRDCDVRKFSPHGAPPAGAVDRALELVGQLEARLQPPKPA